MALIWRGVIARTDAQWWYKLRAGGKRAFFRARLRIANRVGDHLVWRQGGGSQRGEQREASVPVEYNGTEPRTREAEQRSRRFPHARARSMGNPSPATHELNR